MRLRGFLFWAMLVVAAVASAALLMVAQDPVVDPTTHLTLAATTAVTWSAASAVAWSRYRSSSDPTFLYLSAGSAALVAGAVIFTIAFSFAIDLPQVLIRAELSSITPIRRVSPLPVVGWQLTWLVAAGCFVLALPWRDRRGRPPVRPSNVFGITALALAASLPGADYIAELLQEQLPWNGFNIALPGVDRYALGPAGWVLGETIAFLLLVAAFRERARRSGARSAHPWLVVAFLVAVPMHLGVVRHPLQGLGFLTWADALQPLVPAIVLLGLLVSHHEELSRVRRETDRAAEVMGGRAEIASVLAHDLRSPVATIKSLATTTVQSYERLSDAERTEFVGLIEQEASRLLDTVNQASLALKVDAGMVFERRPVDLATVVLEGIEAADPTDHELTAELTPGVTVSADSKYLAEIVRQLVNNAAKFSPSEGPISVAASARGGLATVEITDWGPGIPPERRAEVTERFAQWRPDGYEDRTGAGLGLFICKGILAEHEGELTIDEAVGGGTILRIRLPVEG